MTTLPSTVQILATSETEAEIFTAGAEQAGMQVTGALIYTGIIPPNSYMWIDPYTRMSTPEFFFFRKANQLPEAEAIALGDELCGYYATSATKSDFPSWYWESIPEQRTTKNLINAYLQPVANTPEGKQALAILAKVTDGKEMP